MRASSDRCARLFEWLHGNGGDKRRGAQYTSWPVDLSRERPHRLPPSGDLRGEEVETQRVVLVAVVAGNPFSSGRTPRENTKPLKRSQLIENVITPRKLL